MHEAQLSNRAVPLQGPWVGWDGIHTRADRECVGHRLPHRILCSAAMCIHFVVQGIRFLFVGASFSVASGGNQVQIG